VAGIRSCPRASAVSGAGVPNRYWASSAIRSSEDRRPTLVVYAGKGEGGGNPRVSPWFQDAHRGAARRRREGRRQRRGLLVVEARHGELGAAPDGGAVEML
jgi:hypothetical protein